MAGASASGASAVSVARPPVQLQSKAANPQFHRMLQRLSQQPSLALNWSNANTQDLPRQRQRQRLAQQRQHQAAAGGGASSAGACRGAAGRAAQADLTAGSVGVEAATATAATGGSSAAASAAGKCSLVVLYLHFSSRCRCNRFRNCRRNCRLQLPVQLLASVGAAGSSICWIHKRLTRLC